MTDVDPIEGERFDRGRWPFPGRGEQVTRQLGVDAAKFLGPVPAGETVHGHATADADRAGFQSERHALDQETAAEHIKNALQVIDAGVREDLLESARRIRTPLGSDTRYALPTIQDALVKLDGVRARLARALAAFEGTP